MAMHMATAARTIGRAGTTAAAAAAAAATTSTTTAAAAAPIVVPRVAGLVVPVGADAQQAPQPRDHGLQHVQQECEPRLVFVPLLLLTLSLLAVYLIPECP